MLGNAEWRLRRGAQRAPPRTLRAGSRGTRSRGCPTTRASSGPEEAVPHNGGLPRTEAPPESNE
eukprot:2142430-Alexandrium_andersonii.AAC.1